MHQMNRFDFQHAEHAVLTANSTDTPANSANNQSLA